jgi:hypothetical protein
VQFGREERVENLFRQLRREAYAGVTDRDKNLLVVSPLRLDDHLSDSIHALHRFDAVDDQIHCNLLQLHSISHDLRKVGRQFCADRYVVSRCLAAQEGDGFSVDIVYIDKLSMRGTSAIDVQLLMCSAILAIFWTSIQPERRYSGGQCAWRCANH